MLVLLATAATLVAQGQEPLLKSDLVRLLTTGALSNSEIASLISRNCLAFEPTARDRDQFRSLGANDEVMSAIDVCGSRERVVQVAPSRSRVTARAGGVATVVVQVTRGSQPQEGIELALRGSGTLPGGRGVDAHAFSNSDGNAIFRMPAGTVPGSYQLTIAPAGRVQLEGSRSILLVVVSGAVADAEVRPEQIQITRGDVGEEVLTVVVRDEFGNVISGQEVALQPSSPAIGIEDATQTTNQRGEVTFSFNLGSIQASGRLAIVVGPDELASIPVTVRAGAVAPDLTRWVSGARQSGAVATTLPNPLTLQVSDASGLPIRGQQVVFTATNARVEPPVASTDSTGRVSVTVQLGNALRPATVVAIVDEQRLETVITVTAGPAVDLLITRDGEPVGPDLVFGSKDDVTLRVDAVDAYGNRASLEGLRARVDDERIVRSLGVAFDSTGGRIILKPLRDGATNVTIEAAGLSERVVAQALLSQRPYFPGYTEVYGSGMIATPHSFIATGDQDLFVTIGASFPQIGGSRTANEGGSAIFSWRGRAEIGVAAYSTKDFGVPAKVQIVAPGPAGLSLSAGFLNMIPTSDNIGRHGDQTSPNLYDNYLKRSSPYAVASFARRAPGAPVGFLFSLGWGYGTFYVENPEYSTKGYSYGIFGAAALDAVASPGVVFRLALEHDGWDTNAAGTLLLHGVEVTLGVLAIDEGGAEANSTPANQMRFFARVGAGLNQSKSWLGL